LQAHLTFAKIPQKSKVIAETFIQAKTAPSNPFQSIIILHATENLPKNKVL
jgi:hypothetical protein